MPRRPRRPRRRRRHRRTSTRATAATSDGYWGTAGQEIAWGATPANEIYTLYSGNYLNWVVRPDRLQHAPRDRARRRDATCSIPINGVNVGLAYFNRNTDSLEQRRPRRAMRWRTSTRRAARCRRDQRARCRTATRRCPRRSTKPRSTYTGGTGHLRRSGQRGRVARAERSRRCTTRRSTTTARRTSSCYLTDGEPTRDDAADSAIVAD